MSRGAAIPARSRPREAENIGLHRHRDNSSGGRISARDLTDMEALNSIFDHGALTGLSDDDHAQYLLLANRVGGQTIAQIDTNAAGASNFALTINAAAKVNANNRMNVFKVTGDGITLLSVYAAPDSLSPTKVNLTSGSFFIQSEIGSAVRFGNASSGGTSYFGFNRTGSAEGSELAFFETTDAGRDVDLQGTSGEATWKILSMGVSFQQGVSSGASSRSAVKIGACLSPSLQEDGYASLLLVTSRAGRSQLFLRAIAAQTADYTQWLASDGTTVLAKVTSDAYFSTRQLLLNGSTSGTLTLIPNATTTSYSITWPQAQGAATSYLTNDGAGVLTWTTLGGVYQPLDTDLSQIAALANVRGDLLYTASAPPVWANLAIGITAGMWLRSTGVDVTWSTTTLPNSAATGDLMYASATSTYANLADVAVGSYLRSGGVTTAPLWSTATLPNTAARGDVMRASATNVYSNLTIGAADTFLNSDATDPRWRALDADARTWGTALQTYKHTAFKLIKSTDATRGADFNLDNVGASTVTHLFVPDSAGGNRTLAVLEGTQTFTGQTTIYSDNAAGYLRIADPGSTLGALLDCSNLTGGDHTFAFPDGDGVFLINGAQQTVTSKLFTDSSCSFVDEANTTSRFSVQLSGASGTQTFTFVGSSRNYTIPNVVTPTVIVKGGTDVNVAATTPATAGPTTIVTPAAASQWEVQYYLECSTPDATAGTLSVTTSFTDDVGATTVVSTALVLTATGRTSGVVPIYSASGSITYSTTLTGIAGASKYKLHMRAIAL